jgi:hypothetical protein
MKPSRHLPSTIVFLSALIVLGCMWWADEVVSIAGLFGVETKGMNVGDWGDSFNALNTVFSGMAFLGVATTVYLQLRISRQQHIENGKTEFERTFFQLFSLIRELRSELRFTETRKKPSDSFLGSTSTASEHEDRERQGVDAIKAAYLSIQRALETNSETSKYRSSKRDPQRIYNAIVNRNHEPEFSPYFRAVYTLLRKIDADQFLSEEEKISYSRLLRSQMTSQEIILLGLNGLSKQSRDLKYYIIRFRMLKYAKDGTAKDALSLFYPSETFQGR